MTLLITGATGFVGGALLRSYAEQGAEIIALTRRSADELNESNPYKNVRWIYGDITLPETLSGKLIGVKYLIHSAGQLGAFSISEAQYDKIHVDGTRNLLIEAANRGVEKILHVSTCGVLGPTDKTPQTEDGEYAPSNPYEYSKMEAERLVLKFAAEGVPVTVGRPDFLYGPYDLHVLGLFKAIQSGRYFHINQGRATCVPTYIDDCVDGLKLVLEKGKIGEVYQITGKMPVSFRAMCDQIADSLRAERIWYSMPKPLAYLAAVSFESLHAITGINPPLTRGAVDFFGNDHQFSYKKAYRELGFEPQVGLEEGTKRTVAWYRTNGHLS